MYKDSYHWDKEKRTVRGREVLYHRGLRYCIKRSVLLGPRKLFVAETYLYYGGRDCMKMGILRIKRTVRNRERGVSIIEVELIA